MLTMLVSMFTVMAFAGDKIVITVNVVGANDVNKGGVKMSAFSSAGFETEGFTLEATTDYLAAGYFDLAATCDDAYTVNWDLNGAKTTGKTLSLKDVTADATVTVSFTQTDSGSTEEPEQPEVEHTVHVNIVNPEKGTVKTKGAALLPDLYDGAEIKLTKSAQWPLVATPKEGCEVSWKLNSEAAVSGNEYTLRNITADATLTITFTSTEPDPVPETERTLTVSIGKNGTLTRDGRNVVNNETYDLKSGDTVKFTAYADRNHKVAWKLGDGKTTYSTGRTVEIFVSYSDMKADATLKVWFVSTDSTERTLTLDITRSSYGSVKWKRAGEKTYKPATDNYTWTLTEGDEITFVLNPDYGVVWQLDDSRKYYSETFTLDFDDLDADGSTLYVAFDKKGSSPSYDKSYTLTIDITGAKHGTVKRGSATVKDGDTISLDKNETCTFKASPDKGYVAVWTFQGETYVGNSYTVKMGSKNATLYVEFMDEDDYRLTKLPFRDVSKNDWFYDDVVYVYRNGYMEGVSSTKFAPNQYTTRGQIVTILWRLTGEPRAAKENKFYDVSSKMYYDKAISWAAEAGIVDGFDAHTFKPDENVTREQLAAILYRYADYMNLSTKGASNLTKFDDYNKIGTWARDAMAWANYHGLINGVSYSRIDPKGNATRAQVAAILHRFAVEFGA